MKLFRRNMLQVMVTGALCAGVPSLIWAAPQTIAPEYDVIVIGSGFAGLAAAISAAENGAKVAVLEKMQVAGGNSSRSGGMMAIPGSSVQKEQGIEDSPAKLAADMKRIGLGLGDPEHIKVVTELAAPTFEWTKKQGVVWRTDLTGKGGHSARRCLITKEGTGQGILVPFMARLKELGVPVFTGVKVISLDKNKDGRVIGVTAREGYKFGKEDSGKTVEIKAKDGVILAFGGFSADIAYRTLLDPKLTANLKTTNQPGTTAELMREASRIGANIIQADWIQFLPNTSPDEEGMGMGSHFASVGGSLYGLWLNTNTGKRFTDEFGDRKTATDAIFKVLDAKGRTISVTDAEGVESFKKVRPGAMEILKKNGAVKEYADLDALAKAYGMNPEVLKQTFADFNKSIEAGKDEEFNRKFDKGLKSLTHAPYYVSEMSPKIHHTMGGIATDTSTRVLSVVNDQPIPGLYAAGECTGGIHGAVRIGANAVMDCLVNGKVAGETVMKDAKK
ncbi:FAD-dependent oxidoreductase [Turicimonas muris]|uniref:FAD-dependent oxidoreductase n=1 Tax=Turicimonas muris TaxID=1796652 RepID=UPI002674D5D2|nr:flavocytochrome c [Turicimonas muris]